MRNIVLAAIVILFFGTANAQQKIGHLNSLDVLTSMPEFKTMQDEIEKQKTQYTTALQSMYQDIDKKQKDFQAMANDKSTPDAIVEAKYKEIQDQQQRIQEFENKVNEDLQKMQQDKLKPINDKYLKAVKEVALANGYSYIIDVASGAVAYYPETGGSDVTSLVGKQLGITIIPAGTNTTNKTDNKGTTSPK